MKSTHQLLFVLAGIQLVLPFFLQSSIYEPHRDEFLYLAEARHLAWGYLEAPPLLSLFGWISNYFGGGMFWIKILARIIRLFYFFVSR